jgi:hypothetical protein
MSKCHFRITRRANGGYGEIGRCLDGETMIGKPELKSITGIEKTSDALADVEYEFDFVPDGSNPATACFPGCTGYIYDKVTAFSYIIKKKVRMKRYDDGWRIAD